MGLSLAELLDIIEEGQLQLHLSVLRLLGLLGPGDHNHRAGLLHWSRAQSRLAPGPLLQLRFPQHLQVEFLHHISLAPSVSWGGWVWRVGRVGRGRDRTDAGPQLVAVVVVLTRKLLGRDSPDSVDSKSHLGKDLDPAGSQLLGQDELLLPVVVQLHPLLCWRHLSPHISQLDSLVSNRQN